MKRAEQIKAADLVQTLKDVSTVTQSLHGAHESYGCGCSYHTLRAH